MRTPDERVRSTASRLGLVAVAILFAACTGDEAVTGPQVAPSFSTNGGGGELILCKYTDEPTSQTFDFDVTATTGKVAGNGSFSLSARQDLNVGNECAVVWTGTGGDGTVTITESEPLGWETFEAFWTMVGPIEPVGSSYTVQAPTTSEFIVVKNRPAPIDMTPGRMTGGGGQITIGDVRVTRGFTIHCDITLSNNVEVNWEGNSWHLDKPITAATCIDDPAIDPAPPPAPFDTFIGEGYGRLNNVDGSFIRFTFVDAGEPGGGADRATIDIWAPGADPDVDDPVLSVDGNLDHGNLQAHYDQPHK